MKPIILVCLLMVFSAAHAEYKDDLVPTGKWERLTPEGCVMTFEHQENGRIVRSSGDLIYTTEATFNKVDDKIELTEHLVSHNSKVACSGHEADDVVNHLKEKAYLSISEDFLIYYHGVGKDRFYKFNRVKT